MYRLDLPTNVTFRELMGSIEEYAHPLRDMWTSSWLKAAAVRINETWHLCHFALVGRWSETADTDPEVACGFLCGFLDVVSCFVLPNEVMSHPGMHERVAACLGVESPEVPGPTRAELLALVSS